MKGYKAFDKNMRCKDFQFEVGKTYETDKAKICESGFHFCENPFDCLSYYPLVDSQFCEVEALGETHGHTEDSKKTTTKIKIKANLGLSGFIKASIDFLLDLCKVEPTKINSAKTNDNGENEKNLGSSGNYARIGSSGNSAQIGSSGNSAQIGSSGYYAQIGSSGDSAQIGSSGDSAQIGSSGNYARIGSSGYSAQIGSSGDYARIELNGLYSVGMSAGHGSIIKGKKGSWITLAEWKFDGQRNVPACVKSAQIDGKIMKEGTFYKLVDGEFVEVRE